MADSWNTEETPKRRAGDVAALPKVIASDAAQGGEKKTVEQWATQKGLLRPTEGGLTRVDVKFAAARGLMGWNVGQEVTESDFDQAVDDAMNVRIG